MPLLSKCDSPAYAAPHMGSAYSTIAADVIARFQRLKKQSVVFITGTDEHGEKIAAAAAARQITPQEHCDAVSAEFQQLWQKVGLASTRLVSLCSKTAAAKIHLILHRFVSLSLSL